jgi:hypothetical protein
MTWLLLGVVALYAAGLAVIFVVMCQPPQRFGRFMAYFPMPALALVPFERMWNVARRGTARVGDVAPDFSLPAVDGASAVTLSSFRGKRPVVLVFGSYT